MFIRVIRPDKRESVHQCDGVSINPLDGNTVMLSLQPSGPDIEVSKTGSAFYLMNDTGQTIDSYRWPEKEKEKETNE